MKTILFLMVFTANLIYAQDICESPKEVLENLNTIDKCTVTQLDLYKPNETRHISVKISDNSKRFLKRRKALKNLIIITKNDEKKLND